MKTSHHCECALKIMISIYMIITSAATALAKGLMVCNLSEPVGPRQCFGVVGQPLIFKLSNIANTEITLTKDGAYVIFKISKNLIVSNLSGTFFNRTLKLNNIKKGDSGNYLMEEYAWNGTLLKKVCVYLEIQAPLSKPAVSQMCLSPQQMNVSCSSEGGSELKFILTLDGYVLMQTTTHIQSQTVDIQSTGITNISSVSIRLHGHLTGNFTCLVINNVSREENVIHLNSCKGFYSDACAVAVGVAVAVIPTSLLLLVALCLGRKHRCKKTRSVTVNEGK
ncbi:hypothetical protein PAMA_006297 [Pampus argenteus]